MPNIPNYSLGRLAGSVCDSLGNVGTEDMQHHQVEIKIYPIPAGEKLVVNMEGFHRIGREVIIAAITGQVISWKNIPAGQNEWEMDVSELPGGIYFISIQTSEGKVYRKFVKE